MGGNISSRLTRQFYRFNAENRAQKVIQSKDPRPAPKYEKTLQQVEMMQKEMPNLKEDLAKFDPQLHDRLKHVYVTSDVMPARNVFTKPPPLSPEVRRTVDYGFDENEPAAPGRISLRHVVQMIMTYGKSDDVKIEDLAQTYGIRKEDAENIIKYYQCFTLRLAREKLDKTKFFHSVLVGNESGEVMTAAQFIKRIEDQKGIRDEYTKGIPPLSQDIKALDEAERKKTALPMGRAQKLKVPENPSSDTKELEEEQEEEEKRRLKSPGKKE